MSNYKVTFWGTRGSLVQTSIDKKKYGLETTCISLETDNEILLIDCGSGIRGFDKYFNENNLTNKKINILLTHYHHDHIMGIGFASFLYDKNTEIEIFGLGEVSKILRDYFGPPYFPVSVVGLPNVTTTSVKAFQSLKFEDVEVETTLLNHPQKCLGFKFSLGEKTLTIIMDYEYKDDETKTTVEEFINDSDYLIIDSFYTEEDYKSGWGHNSIKDSINIAKLANVGTCFLTHHNTEYNDSKLDELQLNISNKHKNIFFAKENTSFVL